MARVTTSIEPGFTNASNLARGQFAIVTGNNGLLGEWVGQIFLKVASPDRTGSYMLVRLSDGSTFNENSDVYVKVRLQVLPDGTPIGIVV